MSRLPDGTVPAGPARASTAARPRAASGTGPAGTRDEYRLSHDHAAAGGVLEPPRVVFSNTRQRRTSMRRASLANFTTWSLYMAAITWSCAKAGGTDANDCNPCHAAAPT
ncbi:MAG TPA: hypothetical protein VK784_07070 [Pseudonocardiaceae bacterium]|nr:hypothetical protein [Pseudonocardiaceae bacterium]